jgi:hypothetical protein
VNRWNIPAALENHVIERDRQCVYCGISFALQNPSRGQRASWEHIVNDARIVSAENIARCCMSCNASKGAKSLSAWLQSKYCERKGITVSTVATVVADALIRPPSLLNSVPK